MEYYGLDKKFNFDFKLVLELSSVFGIGRKQAEYYCNKIGVNVDSYVRDIREDDLKKIVFEVRQSGILIGVDLKKSNFEKNKKDIEIKNYIGMRKLFFLPVNGQRTKTNAKTVKKNKR